MSAFVLVTAGPSRTPPTAAAPAQPDAQAQAQAFVGASTRPPAAARPTEARDFNDDATSEAKTAEAASAADASACVAMQQLVARALEMITVSEQVVVEARENTLHMRFLAKHGVAPSSRNLAKLGAVNLYLAEQVALGRHIADDMVVLWLVFRDVTSPDILSTRSDEWCEALPEHIDLMRGGLVARYG